MADSPRIPRLAWTALRKQPMWIQVAGLLVVLVVLVYGGMFWFLRNPGTATMADPGGLRADPARLVDR